MLDAENTAMIYDKLENIRTYKGLSPAWDAAINAIFDHIFADKPEGKYVLQGEQFYYSVQNAAYIRHGQWEAHRKYIDIQFSLTGDEICRCAAVTDLHDWQAYDAARDILFSGDTDSGVSIPLLKGWFIALFPQDAHMPCVPAGDAESGCKVVFKVPMQ